MMYFSVVLGDLYFVLIETYWNVNHILKPVQSSATLVLIETYWNVN